MNPPSAPRPATSIRPWLIALGLWLALAAVVAVALWHLRRDAVNVQARELDLLSLALTDELDRGLRGAEEGLHALRAELSEGHLAVSGAEAGRALSTRANLMPLVRTLWLVDREGHVFASSDATTAPDLATFSPALGKLADGAVAVSRPFMDPRTNSSLVALAARFDLAPGRSGGWIIAAMPGSTLLGAFAAARPAADARMAVSRSDGALLAGANLTKSTLDATGVAVRLANRPGVEVRKFSDDSQRLVGLHSVPRYDLDVMVSRDLGAVLMSWRGAAELTTLAFAVLLAIMALSVYLVQRADQRRRELQHALQAQRSRASKLESLGTLAGGVAHDFNNVLAGIVGFGEMAQDAAAPGSDQARHLDKVLQAALRGKALVERILAFSRGGARASMVFELEPVVEEVLTLLSASLRPGAVLERALDAQGARLRGDPTQAFEAIMNLCTNALQAMPAAGMLSLHLRRLQVASPRVLSHSPLAVGNYLALSVSDQGGGITPDVMDHLFEPFFTTRAAQSGTGLGLAVVFGVVAEFGGAIDVKSAPRPAKADRPPRGSSKVAKPHLLESNPGQGARFTLYLPECTDALDAPQPSSEWAPGGAGQRLLVVDDEPGLVALAEEMLKGLGYDPVGCSDSTVALQLLRADPQRFAAVITDEVMPRLSGTQLTAALRQHCPHLPVLLVSGYGGGLLAQRAAAAGVTRVLVKPLQRADLARALAELLHGDPSDR